VIKYFNNQRLLTERQVNLIQTKQSCIPFSNLLKYQFLKAKNWGRCSSPEEIRIAIVCAVSVSVPLV
jgi:hypothetical protein